MTVKTLYEIFEKKIPVSLREEWDNDGAMCVPDPEAPVRRVLLALDVTEEVADYAVEGGFDLVVSHHPLIFRPVTDMNGENPTPRKLIKLIGSGVSVFSFHTRADKVAGGVNDCLCDKLGLLNVKPFGSDGLGRIGDLSETCTLQDCAFMVKQKLGSDLVLFSDGLNPVRRVAVVGGDGKDYVAEAAKAGADTFLSGRLGYNTMVEAGERGINLIEAGHYFTEAPVLRFFADIIVEAAPDVIVETVPSNTIAAV